MIESFRIMDVASFSDSNLVEVCDKVNLFYGNNGTGKSTIGRVLKNPLEYESCVVNKSSQNPHSEVLVFNSDYIKDNFYDLDVQQGIFTIGESNIEDQKRRKVLVTENKEIEAQIESITKQSDEAKIKYDTLESKTKDIVFAVKQNYENEPIGYCLEGKKTKKSFLDAVKSTPLVDVDYHFEDLIKEVEVLGDEYQLEIPEIKGISNPFDGIVKNKIWQEVIVGSSDSCFFELIEKFKNIDWVKQGIKNLDETNNKCPFCQQDIDDDMISELKNIFNEEYTQKENEVIDLSDKYLSCMKTLSAQIENLLSNSYIDEELKVTGEKLKRILQNNLVSMKDKSKQLSMKVELQEVDYYFRKIEVYIKNANETISSINNKITNRQQAKDDIKVRFWQLVRNKYNNEIINLQAESKSKESVCKNNKTELESINGRFNLNKNEIEKINSKKSGVDKSLNNINNNIVALGLTGFSVVCVEGENANYKIVREHVGNTDVFNTLSEGEKELVAFLYFIETCKGSIEKDGESNLGRKVIVIDDPISSLSHNNVYEVVDLIRSAFTFRDDKNELILKSNQLLILTHDLYFYHEVVTVFAKSERKNRFYRVMKDGLKSYIVPISQKEIKNSYEEYWCDYIRLKDMNYDSYLLPNIMRQILEHYFGFIRSKGKYKQVVQELFAENEDMSVIAFLRRIDRESHSDSTNINDWKKIELTKAHDLFMEIFDRSEHLEHYNYMISNYKESN